MTAGELAESKQTEITIKDVDEMALQTLIGQLYLQFTLYKVLTTFELFFVEFFNEYWHLSTPVAHSVEAGQ